MRGLTVPQIFGRMILACAILYLIWVAAKGLAAPLAQEDFPEALAIKAEQLPILFPLHMVTGALALLLVPLTYALRRTRAHRWVGGATVMLVLVSGLTAFPVAWTAPVTPWSGAGFMSQATVWLLLLGLGLYKLKQRRFAAHRYYMLLMAATTFGAVFFRLWLALWAMLGNYRHYHLVYSLDAWVGWLLPLGVMIVLLQRPHLR